MREDTPAAADRKHKWLLIFWFYFTLNLPKRTEELLLGPFCVLRPFYFILFFLPELKWKQRDISLTETAQRSSDIVLLYARSENRSSAAGMYVSAPRQNLQLLLMVSFSSVRRQYVICIIYVRQWYSYTFEYTVNIYQKKDNQPTSEDHFEHIYSENMQFVFNRMW